MAEILRLTVRSKEHFDTADDPSFRVTFHQSAGTRPKLLANTGGLQTTEAGAGFDSLADALRFVSDLLHDIAGRVDVPLMPVEEAQEA